MEQDSEVKALRCLINDLHEQERNLLPRGVANAFKSIKYFPFAEKQELLFKSEGGYRYNFPKTNYLQSN